VLGVADRTLRRWSDEPTISTIKMLGRPVVRSSRLARNEVIDFIDRHGPRVGVPTLHVCFPSVCRAELEDLLKRYRVVWRHRNRIPLRALRWLVAGRVWAIDFTGPVAGLEDGARYVLAVRDLGSGRQLLWQAVKEATGEVVRQALAALFTRHGAPVVLKSDNGSCFTCGVVREVLAERGVLGLYSPAYWPRYNGAIEAGIGSLKTRTEDWAARAGHAGMWTADDLAGAQAEANTLSRPRGERGGSPDELWSAREVISAEERAAFAAAVARGQEKQKRELEACAAGERGVISESSMARRAIELALVECEYLQYRRRSIPQGNRT
jgi:transposase InsO family protein